MTRVRVVSLRSLGLDQVEVFRLSDRAQFAHCRACFHCAKHLTDGFVSDNELSMLRVRAPERRELTEGGVWDEREGGIEIRGYLAENTSRAEVEARRGKAAQRMRAVRNHVRANKVPESPPVRTNVQANVPVNNGANGGSPSPNPPLHLSSPSGSSMNPEYSSTFSSSPKDLTGSARDSETRAKVEQVFAHWVAFTGKPRAVLDRKRDQRIRARLREGFTPDQLCRAITNARHDRFLMGENKESRVYNGMQTLLRDAEQVERLLALVPNGNRSSGDLRPDRAEAVEKILASARRPVDA